MTNGMSRHAVAGCAATLAAVALLAACSSGGSKPAGTNSSTGGSSSVATSGTTPTTTSSSASKSSSGGGGGSVSLGGSFCSAAKTEQAQEDKTIDAFTDSAASLKSVEQAAAKELPAFEALAPSAIKADVKEVVTVDEQLISSLAKANYDVSKLSPATLGSFNSPALMTANTHIISYLTNVCGIKESTAATTP